MRGERRGCDQRLACGGMYLIISSASSFAMSFRLGLMNIELLERSWRAFQTVVLVVASIRRRLNPTRPTLSPSFRTTPRN